MGISEEQKGELKIDFLVTNFIEKSTGIFSLFILIFIIFFVLKIGLIILINDDKLIENTYNYSASSLLNGLSLYEDLSFNFYTKEGQKVAYLLKEFEQIKPDFEAYLSKVFYLIIVFFFTSILLSFFISKRVIVLLKSLSKKSFFNEKREKKFLRGAQIVDEKTLRSYIESKGMGNSICIGKLPTLKGEENLHAAVMGDIGTGKSQVIMSYVDQIRKRKEKALIYDITGDYVRHYYDEATDIILSPFDERSVNWTPFAEGTSYEALGRMASSFCPRGEVGNINKHWEDAPNLVFKQLLYSMVEEGGDLTNYGILKNLSERHKERVTDELGKERIITRTKLQELVKGSLADLILNEDSPKHASDVISSLVPKIESLVSLLGLEKKRLFSIRDWVENPEEKGILFVRIMDHQMDQCRDLVTAWLDTLVSNVISGQPYPEYRTWLIVDELQGLGKIQSLARLIQQGRKYNTACVLGFTSHHSLEPIYGEKVVQGMLSSMKTKICFATDSPGGADYVSNVIGEEEVIEERSSFTQGRNDHVGEQEDKRRNKLVLPTQIQYLKKFHCFVRLPGGLPVTEVKTEYTPRKVVAEYAVPREVPPPPRFDSGQILDKRTESKKGQVCLR